MPVDRSKKKVADKAGHLSIPPNANWSIDDVPIFLKFLKQVKSSEEIPALREEFLKAHPKCDSCAHQVKCKPNPTENFSVRCERCVGRHQVCPRQTAFCIYYIFRHMEKPMEEIQEMYDVYGDIVRGKFKAETQRKPQGSTIRVSRKVPERHIEYIVISDDDNSDKNGQTSRSKGKEKVKEEIKEQDDVTMAEVGEKASTPEVENANEKVDIEKLLLLTALFAMLRDRIRSKVRKFKADKEVDTLEALLSEIEQLDGIGQGFSDALGDVETNNLEFSKILH
ncbi:hypothetical protein CPB83DRAFT_865014 [Crepidotus variabilis]|uniref:Uncharacterized protein n=1 Tax=Crepidotus variabilis TaxID=179855 RepID=A0A9P6E3V5_9AGAR|nr:hypothetical protein CPB83DRAFT_865014 [Crepidotus variabilis]